MSKVMLAAKWMWVPSALLWMQTVSAQTNQLGGWYSLSLNHHVTNEVVIFGEMQARSQQLANDFYFHEAQAGITYQFPTRNAISVGFGNNDVYSYPGNFKSPASAKEFRIWQQLSLNNNLNRARIEHRYRIEQRWLNGSFRSRIRYRLNTVLPINHASVKVHTLFLTASNEIFFNFASPYFVQNRIYAGLGYQLSKLLALQSGFTRQYDYRAAGNSSGKNFLQTSCLFSTNRSASKRPRHPSTVD